MSRVLSGKLRKAGRRGGPVSSVWSTTARGHRDTRGWKPRALFIQQEFLFKISEIPLVQWNGAFRLHRRDPSHGAFGYCYKQDTKKAILGTTILSNGKGHFGPDLQKRPDRSKLTTFKAGTEYSGRTKPKWSVPFDVPTEVSGVLGWTESVLSLGDGQFRLNRLLFWPLRLGSKKSSHLLQGNFQGRN